MGKSKKIKKGSKDEEVDSDVEVEVPTKDTVSKTKAKSKSKAEEETVLSEEENNASKGGKKKKKVEEKVAQVTKDMKKLDVGNKKITKKKVASSSESDSESESEEEVKSKAKPPAKKGGFALLLMDDSEDESTPTSEEEDEESEEEKPKVVQKKPPPKGVSSEQGGKKGKKKKNKNDSDDEIDKVLAELAMEYSGKKTAEVGKIEEPALPDEKGSKIEKISKTTEDEKADDDEGEEGSTVKTAAQKKKEKKEREKLKKQAAKKQDSKDAKKEKEPTPVPDEPTESQETVASEVTPAQDDGGEDTAEAGDATDKKKKKKKGEKVVEEKTKKGPAKKAIAAMQDALKKIKEEEERMAREEEERIKLEDEREEQRLEALRIEKEKKDRKKKKEKERKDRLKAEGKFLTPKQKADKMRALALVESMKEQGGGLASDISEKKARLGTRVRPNKLKKLSTGDQDTATGDANKVKVEIVDAKTDSKIKTEAVKEGEIKDSWDAESSSSDEEQDEVEDKKPASGVKKEAKVEEASSESSDSSDSEDSDSSDEEAEEDPEEVKIREKALLRMKKRQEENEVHQATSNLRAAIVCVLGHVDTGKTKILDKLRRTNVQDGEAGGITQQIGATNVPVENIKEQTKHVKGVNTIDFKIPGLLIIDTPGHESFSNLRSRGSSLCDIAILVVDIMHGLEPQTIESINLLKARKTPFIVALNKIDRLYDWQSAQRKDLKDIIKSQHDNTQNEFETRTKEVILQFAEQGLNAALYYENPDVRTYVSLVPTSAVTGEGMGNLLALIIQSCEGMLHKRLQFSNTLQATVLEVKAISGLGTTIDAILINGTLREGDTMVLAGTDGPIVTQIRSLLMPQPMKELRVKNAYIEYKEIVAAQGVKIAAKDLEKAVAGLNLLIAHKPDEVEILREQVSKDLKSALSGIRLSERGVYVQASTLGSLEALLEFLKTSKIPYSAIRIGPVVKRDVMKASAMLEHESQYAVILAFDVKVEKDAQEMADSLGVTIFKADIIYHLFDKFMEHRNQLKLRKREEFKHIAVFPCKLKILPQCIFKSRDPIVIGVVVEAGIIKDGTPICVPSKEFVDIGIVTSIESNHKQVETARKGMEVCVKIDPVPGEAPKMFGRHFDETDFLVSKISRASIDACKDYFRDDLIKTDWQLMVELKNMFQIL